MTPKMALRQAKANQARKAQVKGKLFIIDWSPLESFYNALENDPNIKAQNEMMAKLKWVES